MAAALALATAGAATVASSQEPQMTQTEAVEWLAGRLAQFARPGGNLEALKSNARRRIYAAADIDGGGVSASDRDLIEQMRAASHRARRIMRWAELDLDGDGRVTREEVERARTPQAVRKMRPQGITADPTREQLSALLDRLVGDIMSQDLDSDGSVTLEEVLQVARAQWIEQHAGANLSVRRMQMLPLGLDRDGDNVVSAAEFDMSVDGAFALLDADGNGTLSQEEISNARRHWGDRMRLRFRK